MKRNPFTLVEIIMVVALIAVLTGIAIGGYSYAMGASREAATRATIKQLETALENVKAKHGFYLPAATGDKIYLLYNDDADAAKLAKEKWDKEKLQDAISDFLKTLDVESLRQYVDSDGAICDAWGSALIYKSPDTSKKKPFSIRSKGPDGDTGSTASSADDITNWD